MRGVTNAQPWSPQQRQALEQAIAGFKKYVHTEEYQADLREGQARIRFFQQELPGRLEQLSEADVHEIVGMLWAYRMWATNKAYMAQKLVEENGLERLRDHLSLLYRERENPEEAYERFLSSVKWWGPAAVTEVLEYIYPDRCGVWNSRVRVALEALGLADRANVKAYRLSGQEYRRFNALLQALAEELRRAGFQDVNLLVVHFFLYQVSQAAGSQKVAAPVPPQPAPGGFDHDEIRDLIARIGASLGFDTQTEVRIARGAQVDVVWRARIANLGMVTYVFEVHRSGSIDSLVLNLQKALNAPTVQKVVAVSDGEQLRRIEAECADLPEPFRRALRFWDVADVVRAAEALEQALGSIGQLGLLEGSEGRR